MINKKKSYLTLKMKIKISLHYGRNVKLNKLNNLNNNLKTLILI